MGMKTRAKEAIEDIDEDDTVLVLHHWDMDGSAAAAVFSRIVRDVRGEPADFVKVPVGRKHQVGERAKRIIRQEDVTHLVVLDMSVNTDRMRGLMDEYGLSVINIDHHEVPEGLPPEVVLYNPRRDDDEAYIPAAALCNRIARERGLDTDWIAALGVIQDFGVDKCEDIFERLLEKAPKYMPDAVSQNGMAKSCKMGRFASVLNIKSYDKTDKCAAIVHRLLMKIDDLDDLEGSDEYHKIYQYYKRMNDEFRRIKDQFDEEKEVHEDERLVWFRFSSDFHINSSISTTISLDRPEWIYIVAKVEEDEVNVSGRCQSGRIDLGSVLRDALPPDISSGEAGGHKRAAGASLPVEKLDEFKERLLERV